MTAMPPEPGPYRGAEELTTLTAETLAPLIHLNSRHSMPTTQTSSEH
jgi:hypothetical protein